MWKLSLENFSQSSNMMKPIQTCENAFLKLPNVLNLLEVSKLYFCGGSKEEFC